MSKLSAHTNGGFLISKIKQIQGRIFERLLLDAGIHQFNGAQGRILYVLWKRDSIPIRKLADQTGLAKTTLTGMLDRLEEFNLIQRVYDPSDRRIVKIKLTEAARRYQEQYDTVSAEMNNIFYEGFSEEEILSFEKYLARILDNLTRKSDEI